MALCGALAAAPVRAEPLPSARALDAPAALDLLPRFTLLDSGAPEQPEPGILWRVGGTAGGVAFGASLAFWIGIVVASRIPNNTTQARNDTVPLVLASLGGAALGGVSGYFLGRLGDEGSLGAKVGTVALIVVGGLAAVVTIGALTGGFFSLR